MVFLGPPLRDIKAHKQISNNNRYRSRKMILALARDNEEDVIQGTTVMGLPQGTEMELPFLKRRAGGDLQPRGRWAAGGGRAILCKLS